MACIRPTLIAVNLMLFVLACSLTVPATEVQPTPLQLATPQSQSPAAGICAEPTDDEVVMRLEPGIPDPRCIIVQAGQRLRVVNHTGGDVTISLGPYSLLLPSNGETVLGPTFGEYLLPGVHSLQVDPCCGGELWLKE